MFITRAVAIAAVVLLSAFVGVSGAARSPDAPIVIPIDETNTSVTTDLCAFPVTIESHVVGTFTLYLDRKTDTLAQYHVVVTETDTFIGPGATIVGDPYSARNTAKADPEGNITETLHGAIARITLPDGTKLRSAGFSRATNAESMFIINPDKGHSLDVAALCAALAA